MDSSLRRPKIVVLATGGTIASTRGARALTHDYEVAHAADDLLLAVPQARHWADLQCVDLLSLPSHDIGSEHWVVIHESVQGWLDDPSVDGLVLTHGTDCLEETAYFLSLTVRSPKPLVLTGAMRPADHPSPDGPANLLGAIAVAASRQARGKGALVVMSDAIFEARSCAKRHTTSVAAFAATDDGGPIGQVLDREVVFHRSPCARHTGASEFASPLPAQLPIVDVIYDHPSARPPLYEASLASGCAGLVIAGMGNGSLSPGARTGAHLARQRGVPVVRASRCGQGSVTPQALDAQLSTIPANSLSPHKARILLMLALARNADGGQLARQFAEY